MLLILGLIAYFIAYLALKGSMEELWVMRSVGRKKLSVFISLLAELSTPCIMAAIVSYSICIPLLKLDGILPFLYFPGGYILGSICCIGFILQRSMGGLLLEK